jgi:hypothetical protein
MLMNITDITLPMMTQIPTCNVTGCRANIADYASKGWRFETEKFHQCNHCPHMAYIEPPLSISPDWLKMWSVENFFIKSVSLILHVWHFQDRKRLGTMIKTVNVG